MPSPYVRPRKIAGQDITVRCLLPPEARREQFIKEIAEPCLEHIKLGIGDRHRVGPIVRDRPGGQVVLRRPADARPGLRLDVKVVR